MTKWKLEDVHNYARDRLLAARSLCNFVMGTKFAAAYERASEVQQAEIKTLIETSQQTKLANTIQMIIRGDQLGLCSLRELRAIARRYGIRGYAVMLKASLLSVIRNHEQKREESEQVTAPIVSDAKSLGSGESITGGTISP